MKKNTIQPTENTIQPTVNPQQQITITVSPGQSVAKTTDKSVDKEEKKESTKEEGLIEGKTKEKKNPLIPQVPYYSDPLFYEVANYFGLKQEDYDTAKNKLSDIVEYLIRDLDSNKPDDIIPKLRQIEDSIQSAGWDERRYCNFHKYIRLADKKQTIGKMMKAYEKKKTD